MKTNSTNVSEAFDEMSADYEGKIKRWVPYYEDLINHVSHGPRRRLDRVLDLGSGSGSVVRRLIDGHDISFLVMVDASAEMCEHLRKQYRDQIPSRVIQGYMQDIDIEDNSFDMVTASISIHHLKLPEKRKLFGHIYRWLRPGGVFQMADLFVSRSEPGHDRLIQEWKEIAMKNETTPEEWEYIMEHYELYDHPDSFADVHGALTDAGFESVQVLFKKLKFMVIRSTKS